MNARRSLNKHILGGLFSLLYGYCMLVVSGDVFHHGSGVIDYHHWQAQALLHGQLALGDSLEGMKPGLAWYDGKVQQVWGLGVAAWLLPFELLRLPDRLALGLAFALLAFYAINLAGHWAKEGKTAFGIGFLWLVLLSPPLWSLTKVSSQVFEETVLYGTICSLGILLALLRLTDRFNRTDWWILCILSAWAGLVRPTMALYGILGVCLASWLLISRDRQWKLTIVGVTVVLGGLLLLAGANEERFGSPFEFGHRLTISSDSMVYLTRFGNPYSNVSNCSASKELYGMLFGRPAIQDGSVFAGDLVSGQDNEVRYRRFYFSTYDARYVTLVAAAVAGWLIWLAGWKNMLFLEERYLPSVMGIWFVSAAGGLWVFYLHFPTMTSRYLLDFWPAFAGMMLLGLRILFQKWQIVGLVSLAGWIGCEMAMAQFSAGSLRTEWISESRLEAKVNLKLIEYGGKYSTEMPPSRSGIALNGAGWDAASEIAGDIVTVAVDSPQFVELQVSRRRMVNGETLGKDTYHAVMAGKKLPTDSVSQKDGEYKIVFKVPVELQKQNQILFLCFSDGYDVNDRDSERYLHSVRWR